MGENLHCEAKKPFNLLMKSSDGLEWRTIVDTFLTVYVEPEISVEMFDVFERAINNML